MRYDIYLNETQLSESVRALRDARKRIGKEEMIDIRLIWNGGDGERSVCIFAKGANLWVLGYYSQSGDEIFFDKPNKKSIVNYTDNDEGCLLTFPAITSLLEELRKSPAPTDFRPISGSSNRKAYVMSVFVASEIVRNELFEKLLLKAATEENTSTGWWSYSILYNVWAKASGLMYGVSDGFYESIKAESICDKFNLLSGRENSLNPKELRAYSKLIDELQRAGML